MTRSETSLRPPRPCSLALFCKVVDNYGDIGICWRLARQLADEHGIAVTLWVDDLPSFQRICPAVSASADLQQIGAVTVRHWRDQDGVFTANDVADIVIEFFACDIPPGYISAMATRTTRAVWLNLEGLTAEAWVEGCHTLSSPHPSLPLTKYFFFPGFTSSTGGLLHEAGLSQARRTFLSGHTGIAAFLARFGVTAAEMAALKVSLFCYPEAPVAELFAAWQAGAEAVTCMVPEGVAVAAVSDFLGQPAIAGAGMTRAALTVRVLPFVPQSDYDKLLWACDVNFVRGEDSFVRAQWAGKPFIWHIYPQDKDLHHVKLNAFLTAYAAGTGSLATLSHAWNKVSNVPVDWPAVWSAFTADRSEITARSDHWERQMLANGDLTSNLLQFATRVRSA